MPKSFYRDFFIISLFLLFFFAAICGVKAQESHFLIIEVQIAGDETDFDYIKIYNSFNEEKDVSGFKLKKRTSSGTESSISVFPEGTKIQANNFIIWANKKYSSQISASLESTAVLSKNNSIALFDKDNVLLDALAWGESENSFIEGVSFSQNPEKNQQLNRKQISGVYIDTNNNSSDFEIKGASQETTIPEQQEEANEESQSTTESSINFDVIIGNQPPVANAGQDVVVLAGEIIEFDGSNSYEAENQKIYFFWNFGDGKTSEDIKPSHQYDFPGNYHVVLEVSDGAKSATDDLIVLVLPKGIIISEVFPNPESVDKGKEWIEIYNDNEQIIDISGFGIISKNSKFVFPKNSFIFGKQFLTIKPNFSLTNKDGEMEFVYPNKWRIQKINYSGVKEGQSLVFFNNDFYFSNTPTPNQKNALSIKDKTIAAKNNNARDFIVKEISSQAITKEFNLDNINSGLVIMQNSESGNINNDNSSPSNFSENNIKSVIKAQVGNIKIRDLLILLFPTTLGLVFFIFLFFKKRINY